MTPALVLDDVTVSFGELEALSGITVTVEPGRSVALVGPNGAGKSTLLRAILGLVPLERGRIEVLGTTPAAARGSVAYVPQADTLDRDFPVTALEVTLMGRYRRIGWFRRPKASDRAAAMTALDEVGLADRAHDRFGTLSGGQRQRVLLARAICQEARLLLLDEPFNGIDAATLDSLVPVLAHLRAEGAAILMPTHDLAIAHLTCGDACILNRHQVAFGPIGDALSAETLRSLYDHHHELVDSDDDVVVT